MSAALPPAPPRSVVSRRPVFWVIVAAVVVALVLAVTAGYLVASAETRADAASTASPRPTPTVSRAPTTVPSPTADPVASGPTVPKDCAGVYTKDWAPEMDGLVLNPSWTEDPASGVRYGSKDTGLVTMLEATTKVTCVWAHPNGGSDAGGVVTNIAALTPEQQADVIAHMQASGYDCYEELGGTRCVTETSGDNGTTGESDFVRDGIWSATWWLNVSPDGYTHDIVTAIFGA